MLVFSVEGSGAARLFAHEAGGHRWQRVPPNEKRGRTHTSTVTVAVLSEPAPAACVIPESELAWRVTTGGGPGGQHRNKTMSAVEVTHTPTGIKARSDGERSQHANKRSALAVLRARVAEARSQEAATGRNDTRRRQVGSGQRGDKVRTVQLQNDRVTDHRTGRSAPAHRYLRGDLAWLNE